MPFGQHKLVVLAHYKMMQKEYRVKARQITANVPDFGFVMHLQKTPTRCAA